MTTINVYETCPVYETTSFTLRLVRIEDAKALLSCYSDKLAVSRINADCCTSDFYYTTLTQMEDCIRFWLWSYETHSFVRFSVIPKGNDDPVGTVEIFGGEWGILRIDLETAYDTENYVEELLQLALAHFIRDFQVESLKIKASNTPDRVPLFKKHGLVLSKTFHSELGYYEYPV